MWGEGYMQKDKSLLVEYASLGVLVISLLFQLFFFINYYKDNIVSQTELSKVTRKIGELDLKSRETNQLQADTLKKLEINIQQQERINKITPHFFITAEIDTLGKANIGPKKFKIVSPSLLLKNPTAIPVFIDAVKMSCYISNIDEKKLNILQNKIMNLPNENGVLQWEKIFETAGSNTCFNIYIDKYDAADISLYKKISNTKDMSLQVNKYIDLNTTHLISKNFSVQCPFIVLFYIDALVFYRYKIGDNEIFASATASKVRLIGNND